MTGLKNKGIVKKCQLFLEDGTIYMYCCVAVQVVESLYGQDLDSGHHGSGFPLPPFRQRLLEAHLAATEGFKKDGEGRKFTPEETAYSEHKWNINNMPRCKVHTCCDCLLVPILPANLPGAIVFI